MTSSTSAPTATGPGTVLKATVGTTVTTLAWSIAGATRPDQVVALLTSYLGDAATWLVPNDAEHPRWYRRAAKACVSASTAALAAVPLALGRWEGDGGDLTIAGVYLQLSASDWTTLGLLVARAGLVALLPNTTAVDPTIERETADIAAPVGADLSGEVIGEDEDGARITSTLPVVPAVATPSDLAALQRRTAAIAPQRRARRAEREGRHEVSVR